MTDQTQPSFVRGNNKLAAALQRPGMAEAVAGLEREAADLNRTHAMSLAMIREAGQRTQTELAHQLGITQGAVSQLEKRNDLLLSTLRNYLTAAGATDPRIVVTINGHDVAVDLAGLASSS